MGIFEHFIEDETRAWNEVSEGVARKIMAYDDDLMIVKVSFEEGGIGAIHRHVHTQTTYIESGVFEVTIAGKTKMLKKGDAFFIRSNEFHGVKCLASGLLIDVFNPYREDFIK